MRETAPDPRFLRPSDGDAGRSAGASGSGWSTPPLVGSLVMAATLIVAVLGYLWLDRSGALAVTQVDLDGYQRTTPELLDEVRHDIAGHNILTLDLALVGQRIRAAEPWVRGTTIRRIFPDQVAVTVAEHQAIARAADGRVLLTADGGLLPPTPELATDAALPEILVPADASAESLGRAAELLDLLRRGQQPLAGRLARLDLTDPADLVLHLVDASYAIHLGEADFAGRLNRFLNVEPLLNTRYNDLQSVDLRFRDRVIVAPVPVAAADQQG